MKASSEAKQRLLIASDHAGFHLKEFLKGQLTQFEWLDLGPESAERVDYPDFADRLVHRLLDEKKSGSLGILICGSGQGMAIRANRFSGVRAALAWNEISTTLAREHNDANVLCLGARLLEPELCAKMVELFAATPFEGGRHLDRLKKLEAPC